MPWGAVGAVAGALITSSSAGDAADAQTQSADKADATQRYQYDTTRADNAPFHDSGVAANNQLSYRLGLGTGGGSANALTSNQIRTELLPQFSKGSGWTMVQPETADSIAYWRNNSTGDVRSGTAAGPRDNGMSDPYWYENVAKQDGRWNGVVGPGNQQTVDEAGLNAAIEQRLQQQQQQQQQQQSSAQNDPAYGSLMRNFTMADRDADPVYQSGLQFGLNEGTKGINRMAAASGSSLSGATLKALTRFGNDYGSTKANESYNRFNTNQNSLYNKLAGVSGAGQQATNQVSAAGQNMANNVSNNALYAGSVRGASAIAQGNALTGAMNNIYGVGKKKGWWDTAPGSGGGLSDFTPSYAGTGNPFNWTNGDS